MPVTTKVLFFSFQEWFPLNHVAEVFQHHGYKETGVDGVNLRDRYGDFAGYQMLTHWFYRNVFKTSHDEIFETAVHHHLGWTCAGGL